MNPLVDSLDEHARDQLQANEHLVEHYWRIVLFFVIVFFFRKEIMQFIGVLGWKIGRRYNERMKVIVNGKHCRIAIIGMLYVEFYVYDKVDSPPEQGWSWLVSGDRLSKLDILIPLEKHEGFEGKIQTLY